MADVARQIRVSEASHDEDNLPLPPPPPIPPRPLHYDDPSATGGLPPPPPKETFAVFYQQQQKNELKRLFKHIHPGLKGNLNDVVDDELVDAIQSEHSQSGEGYQGEVQSMRWIFENWTLDNIGDPHTTKKLLEEEGLQGGDVRGTSSMFEHVDSSQHSLGEINRQTSVRGDVRTSTWLFETQPLDTLNKLKPEEGELVEAVLKEPIQSGDVRGARLLFESKPLDALGRYSSVEDQNFLRLKSELREQKGDVQKTVKLFQTEPHCAIRDNSGNIHKIKSICREEVQSSRTRTARWLFETQPLDVINKGTDGVKIIRGISLEEGQKGGVDRNRWMFETQPFTTIREGMEEDFKGTLAELSVEADVENKRKLFETQPMAALKGDSTEMALEKEVIPHGDVKSSLWLFETQPMDTLKENYDVGQLRKISLSAEEQGEVKGKKQMFENYNLRENAAIGEQEIEKGDVKSFKHLFETIPLCNIAQSAEQTNETRENGITAGNVKGNKALFETTPLYAIKDCSGNFHAVTTVSREECIKGSVKNYKWMFETKPLDEFEEGQEKVEVIKGITRQEDVTKDVNTTKWLFETQSLDCIHSKFNQTRENESMPEGESQKGDVKTCKWLFETQPMDLLKDRPNKSLDKETIENTNVKSFTWLFESQPLDSIKKSDEHSLRLSGTIQDGTNAEAGVKTVKHLFETETLDRIRKNSGTEKDVRYVSEVNVRSGDVSRVKEIFESQSLDEIGSELVPTTEEQNQDIPQGSVNKFTWLFENRPITMINDKEHDGTGIQSAHEVSGGDVHNKKFIFETFSLDKIHESPLEQRSVCVERPESSVDVKSSTMLFESQPLYAIRDKEGQFHEVTTVKKEEVMSGDVRGARWMFETKPLDAIKAENEVYVIRAVTQEDVLKGDVKSARWKFETQPFDSLAGQEEKPSVKFVDDFGNGNVKINKELFESDQSAQNRCVRMVSVTDVQQGDVRTSTWLFENQPISSLTGEPREQAPVQTVQREDNQKGEVKRCTWLFESQPLDKIKEAGAASPHAAGEAVPKADVKSTTWLFETTPLDQITVGTVVDSLTRLQQLELIRSSGIVIESNEVKSVCMAKYQLISQESVEIQKEEVVEGNIRNIMLQLLYKPTLNRQITLLREVKPGEVTTTVIELPGNQTASSNGLDRDQEIQNVARFIESHLVESKALKRGIVMQESAGGQAHMIVYSFFSHCEASKESQGMIRGDVKSTIGNLLASANNQRQSNAYTLDQNERGNVNLYRSCIEKGDLQYLKTLQNEVSENEEAREEEIEIIQGDVKEAKRNLYQQKEQVERTISDILPGDVKSTKRVFLSAGSMDLSHDCVIPREEILSGDIQTAKNQLGQAVKLPVMVEKEEVVAGDIRATMLSLERAKQQSMHVEREVIKPGTIYDMDLSAQCPATEGNHTEKEEIVCGDVKAAKQSLEMAKNQSLRAEREVISPGKIYNLNVSAQEQDAAVGTQSTASSSRSSSASSSASSSSRGQRITTTFRKVSDSDRGQPSPNIFEARPQSDVPRSAGDVVDAKHDASQPVVDSIPLQLFENSEWDAVAAEEEREAEVRGDVKAAIRSLQNAATEQKPVDKEDVVRGNMHMTLQSLEKSSINVSKGDFKAAMIYRNSGKAYSASSKTVNKQGVVGSVPPSDPVLSPSVSVTYRGQPPSAAGNSTPAPQPDGNSNLTIPEVAAPPPLPPKASEKPKAQRPALPPKPQPSQIANVSDAHNIHSPPPPPRHLSAKASCPIKDSTSNPCVAPVMKLAKHPSTASPHKQLGDKTQTPQISQHKETPTHKLNEKHKALHCSNSNPTHNSKAALAAEQKAPRKTVDTTAEDKRTATLDRKLDTEMDRNTIQKINAAEEIRMCMQSNEEEAQHEINVGFQVALQNFGEKERSCVDKATVLPKKVKVVQDQYRQDKLTNKSPVPHGKYNSNTACQQHCNNDTLKSVCNKETGEFLSIQNNCQEGHQKTADKVVLRKKKAKKETEDERWQRLSVHKDEIMKGNVKAAMEIFENLRKREELKIILSQVQEIEGETSSVDVSSMKSLFENVPAWIVMPSGNTKRSQTKWEKNVEMEPRRVESENESSVESAFGDLEKASKEILNLKEQTLAKLIDIEEAIRKALYSVSNLKSEADIAGLSGLFNESLKSEQSCPPANNIRKISIVSSKTKPEQSKEEPAENMTEETAPKQFEVAPSKRQDKPLVRQSSSSSSPSFISIHSAARKPTDQPNYPVSTFKPKSEMAPQSSPSVKVSPSHFCSPATPRRKVSVLEVQTVPEAAAGIIGTKTVSEKYEEKDCYGNSFVSSTTSTFVTKQSESKVFEVVSNPSRYEVISSPRAGRSFSENAQSNVKQGGTVFVTFGQPNAGKR
ncbi:xin actin-binding repeat-containing protein 1 [Aplochiton taeniatus]